MSKDKKIKLVLLTIAFIVLFAMCLKYAMKSPADMLSEIDNYYLTDKYAFISLLDVPSEQKDDCVHWALGEKWSEIKRNHRADKFRELHPELNLEDFADSTPILVFWERASKEYMKK